MPLLEIAGIYLKSIMNHPNSDKKSKNLALPGIITLGLLWALGLLGFGLWRNLQPSASLTQQTQNSLSNQTSEASTFAQIKSLPSGRFKYSGSPDWSSIRLVVDSVIQSERREYQLSYVQPVDKEVNSTTAIELLLQNRLDLVQSGRALQPWEIKEAQDKGIELQQIPIAIDGIAIAVHPSLPIQALTLQDVAKIYQGQITNWQQLDGPDLEIQPYALSEGSEGIVDLFLQQVMQEKSYGDNLDSFKNVTVALRRLANSPGGIFFGSAAEIVPQCTIKPLPLKLSSQQTIAPYQSPYITSNQCPTQRNQINVEAFSDQQYPLTHQLYVIYKTDNDDQGEAGQAYSQMLLTQQGQDLITKAGFVSITKESTKK